MKLKDVNNYQLQVRPFSSLKLRHNSKHNEVCLYIYQGTHHWASLVAQMVKNPPAMWETWVQSLGWEDPWRRERLPTPVFWPGEFHGLYGPWGLKESDTTERFSLSTI